VKAAGDIRYGGAPATIFWRSQSMPIRFIDITELWWRTIGKKMASQSR
jgi:hypothetical protein